MRNISRVTTSIKISHSIAVVRLKKVEMVQWIIFIHFAAIIVIVSSEINISNHPCHKNYNYRNAKIVGGYTARRDESSYVAVLTRSGGNIFCGSAIISDKFILTAAHCVCNNKNKLIQPTQMRVYVGIYDISEIQKIQQNQIDDGMATEVIVEKIIVHSDYVCGKKSDSDIALLQLKKSIRFSDFIKPICVETKDINISDLGIVSGFGMTHEDFSIGEKPKTLQSANVPIWTNDECQASYASYSKTFIISKRQICAGGRNGASIDACYSDSGGPLVDSKTGALIGVVSNGIGCGRNGSPGIYTRVTQYIDWIQEHVRL